MSKEVLKFSVGCHVLCCYGDGKGTCIDSGKAQNVWFIAVGTVMIKVLCYFEGLLFHFQL